MQHIEDVKEYWNLRAKGFSDAVEEELSQELSLIHISLSGIPSIVYGLFGMLFFVVALKWGMSLLSGAFTMVIMVLPLIMRTAEEALKSVPDSYREASFGLGAGKLRTIFTIVLPSAVPGILAGVILAIGRVVGETAALIYTAGTVAAVPDSLMGSGRTLALHMYVPVSYTHLDVYKRQGVMYAGPIADGAAAAAALLLAVRELKRLRPVVA